MCIKVIMRIWVIEFLRNYILLHARDDIVDLLNWNILL